MAKHDIFISYNRKDASFVEFLVRCFELAGLNCFQDVSGLNIFDKLDSTLKSAISHSRWLIAIISPSYLQSYWCLFESIEAIQGQDIEQRFLPVVLRYSPDDQSLDEQFVLRALRDLDEQMTLFETQMVQMKAFDLSEKLKKLQFVRAYLPAVFRQMHERIYPQFSLWDDSAVRSTLKQILQHLAPSSGVDVSKIPLSFRHLSAMPVVVPRLRTLPSILWSAKVGCQAWKNSPLIVGNDVFASSSGNDWNEPDVADGIYCLDAETGIQKWFAHTKSDPNRLMVSKGKIITGCDDGTVVAVSATDGKIIWQVKVDSAVVGGPVKLSSIAAGRVAEQPLAESVDPFLVVTYNGALYLMDLRTGREIQRLELGRNVIGDIAFAHLDFRDRLWIPTVNGELMFVSYDSIGIKLFCTNASKLKYADKYEEVGQSMATLAVPPLVAEGILIQGLVRQTYYDDPPLLALDATSSELRWVATNAQTNATGFGNLRSRPVLIGREIIFATAYTGGLAAVSVDDGQLIWTLDLGQTMFEQWSGPIASEHSVYLGRHDGYLHKINVATRTREWSIFLGDSSHAGTTVAAEQALPEFQAQAAWSAGSSPILATPVLDRGRLYVGTHEGFLYCLANLGEDADANSRE